ncbi:hypothetical protein ACLB2K_051598 [Fragaria x ananassa]
MAVVETKDTEANQRIQELKEEVKRVIISSLPSQRLDLIDYIQRLGVSYRFEDEIHQLLQQIHNRYSSSSSSSSCYDDDDDDLHTVALRFRLLRQQGFKGRVDLALEFRGGGSQSLYCFAVSLQRRHGSQAWSSAGLNSGQGLRRKCPSDRVDWT